MSSPLNTATATTHNTKSTTVMDMQRHTDFLVCVLEQAEGIIATIEVNSKYHLLIKALLASIKKLNDALLLNLDGKPAIEQLELIIINRFRITEHLCYLINFIKKRGQVEIIPLALVQLMTTLKECYGKEIAKYKQDETLLSAFYAWRKSAEYHNFNKTHDQFVIQHCEQQAQLLTKTRKPAAGLEPGVIWAQPVTPPSPKPRAIIVYTSKNPHVFSCQENKHQPKLAKSTAKPVAKNDYTKLNP